MNECDSCGKTDAVCHCSIREQFDDIIEYINELKNDLWWLKINHRGRIEDIEQKLEKIMHKDIKKIEEQEKKVGKDLKKLEKKDIKMDKFAEAGKKAMKQAKKK